MNLSTTLLLAAALSCGASPSAPASDLPQRILVAAKQYVGTPTGNLAGGGAASSASAVQAIVMRATGATIGGASIDAWYAAAASGVYGGRLLPVDSTAGARPGAIIMAFDHLPPHDYVGHIGICANDGCTETWSNHGGSGGRTSAFAYDLIARKDIVGSTGFGFRHFVIWMASRISQVTVSNQCSPISLKGMQS